MMALLRFLENGLDIFGKLLDFVVYATVAVGAFIVARLVLGDLEYGVFAQYAGALVAALVAAGIARVVWWLVKVLSV